MKQNVGGWDRKMRWIFGGAALLTGLSAPLPRAWRIGLVSLGATNLVTAATRYCPLNQALNLDTREHPLHGAIRSAGRALKQVA